MVYNTHMKSLIPLSMVFIRNAQRGIELIGNTLVLNNIIIENNIIENNGLQDNSQIGGGIGFEGDNVIIRNEYNRTTNQDEVQL